jgi:hypothetical protein
VKPESQKDANRAHARGADERSRLRRAEGSTAALWPATSRQAVPARRRPHCSRRARRRHRLQPLERTRTAGLARGASSASRRYSPFTCSPAAARLPGTRPSCPAHTWSSWLPFSARASRSRRWCGRWGCALTRPTRLRYATMHAPPRRRPGRSRLCQTAGDGDAPPGPVGRPQSGPGRMRPGEGEEGLVVHNNVMQLSSEVRTAGCLTPCAWPRGRWVR